MKQINHYYIAALALFSALFFLTQCQKKGLEVKPNIIFIMLDDMGYADTGVYGSEHIRTPNIDLIAAQGLRFTQAYAGNTVCAPSRSTLMTGTHMGTTPVRSNSGGVSLRPEDVTIAEILNEAGYATGGYGKWGLSEIGQPGVPENKGFDEFFGYYHQIHAHRFYPEYLYRNSEKVLLPGNEDFYDGPYGEGRGIGPVPLVNSETGEEFQFSHYQIFEKTMEFIRENHDGPFFAYVPWTPPHSRYELPEDDPAWQMYKDEKWPLSTRVYAAFNTMADRHVGEVMALLKDLGIDEETIVIFTSDNGGPGNMNRGVLQSNRPFRGGKTELFEGGLRVPFIVRWPGVIDSGQTTDHITYFPDFFPTFAELAGVEARVPEVVNGISLVPELIGSEAAGRKQEAHEYLYWEYADMDWSEVRYLHDETLRQAVRSGEWKAYRPGPGEPLQLFNLADDIREEHNVAADYPEIVARMEEFIEDAYSPPPPQMEPERIDGKPFR